MVEDKKGKSVLVWWGRTQKFIWESNVGESTSIWSFLKKFKLSVCVLEKTDLSFLVEIVDMGRAPNFKDICYKSGIYIVLFPTFESHNYFNT